MSTFQKFSVTKAIKGLGYGLVAKNDKFEVYAARSRSGPDGDRRTRVSFDVVRVLSAEPRKVESVEMPVTHRSNLDKILALLETMS